MVFQRLSSFSLKQSLSNFNLTGLMANSIYVSTALIVINEYVVYKLASAGSVHKNYQEVYRQTLIPRFKPDFIKKWEEKYGEK
ncbi:cpdA [Acrasis kona]|uniref:CpdA n=1 Tax=Acrasis kona TaxID=1008807 RepID=A0AAW2Z7B9_9EUKA